MGQRCDAGWPVVLGGQQGLGSTTVTAWARGPYSDNYIIGGSSNDPEFTEAIKGECVNNCAFLTSWSPAN